MAEPLKLLTRNLGKSNSAHIDSYMASGGYEPLMKALHKMSPEQALGEVKTADARKAPI